jgi:hypothetical protein
VSAWKRQAVESLSAFFDGMARPQAPESELFEQIGRLKMELEWLKKKYGARPAAGADRPEVQTEYLQAV